MDTETFPAWTGGVNLERPGSEIDNGEAQMIQDAFVNLPTYLRQRGPVKILTSAPDIPYQPWAIVTVVDPQGTQRVGVLNGHSNATSTFSILNTSLNAIDVDISLSITFTPGSSIRPYIQTSPAPQGVMIGWSTHYGYSLSPNQGILYWGGGNKADYTNTATTATRGSTSVTCTAGFTANVSAGMWLFNNSGVLVGQVLRVVNNTSLTLVKPARVAIAAANGVFKSIRGMTDHHDVMTGTITTSSGSAVVNGGDTKFTKQLAGGSTYDVYRWSSQVFDGTITSIASDTQMTYTANSAIGNQFDERYVAVYNAATFPYTYGTSHTYGWIPAVYAGTTWYANNANSLRTTYRVYFSDPENENALDSTQDGDWIDVQSSQSDQKPIKGMAATQNSLLIFKEDETFAIYGSSSDNFTLQRIHDDGLWSPMTIQPFRNGVIWAGKRGIYYYDGASISNLIEEKMGNVWRKGFATLDPGNYLQWSMLDNDHYFIHFYWNGPVSYVEGNTTTTPNMWTLALDLNSGAVTFHSNLWIRGSVRLPGVYANKTLYVVPTSSTTIGKVCTAYDLWNTTGADTVSCANELGSSAAGPHVHVYSKLFSGNDPVGIKKWRQVTADYKTATAGLAIDLVSELQETTPAVANGTAFANTSNVWDTARYQFGKMANHFGFRLYANGSPTVCQIGPFSLKYKRFRPWRVTHA